MGLDEADRRLAGAMSRYWVNFARSGDPNGPGLRQWPAFRGERGLVLVLDERIALAAAPVDRQLVVFDSVYDTVRRSPFGVGRAAANR